MASSPATHMADPVCDTARERSVDSKDPAGSEIPIAQSMPIRGSYTSGFSTPHGARNPSTVQTFRYLKERAARGEIALPDNSRPLSSFGQEARHRNANPA